MLKRECAIRQSRTAVPTITVLCALALAGCSSTGPSATAKGLPAIPFKSPAIRGTLIPTRYTCDGKDLSPPLEWGEVPPGIATLVLFVVGFTPEHATKSTKVSVEWAVAGLSPDLHRLAAGQLPSEAFAGVTSNGGKGYSVCPQKGSRVQYAFELYGLPSGYSISPNFAGLPVFAQLTNTSASTHVYAHGAFAAVYKRR